MSKTTLVLFWIMWLLDLLMALFGHREFITGVFGRYAAPNKKYKIFWSAALIAIFLILWASIYFKQHGQMTTAITVAAVPLLLVSPYALFLGAMLIFGRNSNWR